MRATVICFLACALAAVPASAQEHRSWPERVFVTFEVPFQSLDNGFEEVVAYPDTLRRTENITLNTTYDAMRGVMLAAGGGTRVFRSIGAGIMATWFRPTGTASYAVGIPNPLIANRPLTSTGSLDELNREEIGVHLQALYAVPLGSRMRIMLSAGPSFFQLKQDVLTSVEFDRSPGFTRLDFHDAVVTAADENLVGFNVGADVTWQPWKHLGIASVTRYSRATVMIDPGSTPATSRQIELRAGGLQLGGGVRLMF